MKKLFVALLTVLALSCVFLVGCGKATYTVAVSVNNAEFGMVSETNIADVTEGTEIKVNGNKLTIGETEIVATPTVSDAQYTYSFVNWTAADTVDDNITITANFTRTVNNYDVTFKVDGEEYDKVSVEYGATAVLSKADPEKTGYTFKGWDASLENIIEETEVNAIFEINKYTVVFKVDGEEYDSVEVEHGATAVLSKADPEKTN
ncbi:MAG: InlB B-repeat-containing protein, partial [Clostridia bacterium]|nr:InlB B-repeat-containing protein [Clostridia bacterium]